MLTEIRPLHSDAGFRDEKNAPERRRRVIRVDNPQAVERMWRALVSLGNVRAGRQRLKVIAFGRLVNCDAARSSQQGGQ
jgi:hypothetical protein